MENQSSIVVGLDIGTTKISVIVGRKDSHGKLEILGMGKSVSLGVMRGIVSNIDKTVESIKIAVAEAEEKSGIKIKEVYVGIAGQHIRSMQHRGAMVRDNVKIEITQLDLDKLKDDMFKLVTIPGEVIIHVIPQEYTVDGEDGIQDPKGMSGVKIEANFHIITAQLGSVTNIYRCVEKAGLEVKDLILEPFASATATLDKEELSEGVVMVDIGGGTTDIAIFLDGIIRHTAVIPFGGNVITKDVKVGLSILEKQAELLKIKFGSAIHSAEQDNIMISIPGLRGREAKEISMKNLSGIIGSRMQEIIDLVNHEIKVSGYENKLMTGIVITGGGAQLKSLGPLVSYITGKDVRIGLPNEHLGKDSFGKVTSPIYSTGVGLVLLGFEGVAPMIVDETEDSDSPQNEEVPTEPVIKQLGFFDKIKNRLSEFFSDENIK